MKHLVFFTTGFPKNEKDTQCTPAIQIYLRQLFNTGLYKITVITAYYPHEEKTYDWLGIKVISFAAKSDPVSDVLLMIKIFDLLSKINKEEKIDIIHSFWLNKFFLVNEIFCKINKIPLFVTFMGRDVYGANKLDILNKFLKLKSKFVTLTNFQEQVFRKTCKNIHTFIIPWGLEDISQFNSVNTQKKRKFDIIGAFSFNDVKNIDYFIEIIKNTQKTKEDLKVIIAGGGDHHQRIKDKVLNIGLNEIIEFTGFIERPEVIKLMHQSKILLHTSSFESFCLSMAEALASGCRVVSCPIGIAFDDENILTGKNINELCYLVNTILVKPNTPIAIDNYKISKTVEMYQNLYFPDLLKSSEINIPDTMMQQKIFDNYAKDYDEHFTNSLIGKAQRSLVYKFFEKFIQVNSSDQQKILELNCGTGEDAIWLSNHGFNVLATDISEKMIDTAISKAEKNAVQIQFIQSSVQNILANTNNQTFNIIFSNFGGLNCISPEELKKLSSECLTLTNKTSFVAFVIMGRKCIWEKFFFTWKKDKQKSKRRKSLDGVKAIIDNNEFLIWYYSPKEIKELFNESFEIITVKPIGIFIPPSYLENWIKNKKWLFTILLFIENIFGSFSFLSDYADHYFILLKKK